MRYRESVSANQEPAAATQQRIPHATLRYTTLRLALFLVSLMVIWGIAALAGMNLNDGADRLFLLMIALVISSIASFFVLSRYRDQMSVGIVERTNRMSRKLQDSASFEDAEDEEDA